MAVDQGIHYELRAMVSFPDVLTPLAATRPPARVVLLDQDLALIPVTPEVAAALHCSHVRPPPETGFRGLTAGVYGALRVASMAGPIGYLEADYTGRDGWQAATVFAEGEIVYGPAYLHPSEGFPPRGAAPIAEALRRLGAIAVGRHDEFVMVGLGRYRNTTAWHEAALSEAAP